MMKIKNSQSGYGLVAIFFHWVMALLMIGLIALGIYMVNLSISLHKLKMYGLHKEFGLLVLWLVMLRLLWRLINVLPKLPEHLPPWQKFSARSAHIFFYLLMFALPLTGWLMTSAAGLPPSFFGLFVLPDLVSPDKQLMAQLVFVHKWLAYALIGLIGVHTSAALYHHFYLKDHVLRRMISWFD